MTNHETRKPARMEAEFRRQMRSGQMSRFVGTLPVYEVHEDMPDRFAELLQELDRAVAAQTASTSKARN